MDDHPELETPVSRPRFPPELVERVLKEFDNLPISRANLRFLAERGDPMFRARLEDLCTWSISASQIIVLLRRKGGAGQLEEMAERIVRLENLLREVEQIVYDWNLQQVP